MLVFSSPCQLALWALCFPITYASAIPRNEVTTTIRSANTTSACSKALPSGVAVGETANISLTSNGIERSYLINIPETYESKAASPIVLSYHGGQRNASSQLELDLLTSPEFNTLGAILVYPQGIGEIWQGIPGSTANDTGFTHDILTSLSEDYCVDSTRIYATGKSDGAGFTNTLACDPTLSTMIAAFAPVSGAFYQSTLPCNPTSTNIQCVPGREKVPFLEFHGGNDSTIDYFGGERKDACLPAITYLIQSWVMRNGMSLQFTTNLTALDTVVFSYGTGSDTGLVTHVFDTNIGHDWPSTMPNDDNTEAGHHVASFNASTAIMDFFGQYTLPSTSDSSSPILVAGTPLRLIT